MSQQRPLAWQKSALRLPLSLLLLPLLIASGCRRGCAANEPAERCTDSSTCKEGLRCFEEQCVSPGYIAAVEGCRKSKVCEELGACGVVNEESLLGLSGGLQCAAWSEEGCRASRVCRESGKCHPQDLVCVALSEADCTASERCQSHEECSFSAGECVRPWKECDEVARPPLAPAWARASVRPVDVSAFDALHQVGALEKGIVACRIETKNFWPVRVQLGARCAQLGAVAAGDSPVTFALRDVSLTTGEWFQVAFQKPGADATPRSSSFAKARYEGVSPFSGGTPGEQLTCYVVSPEAAMAFSDRALATVDKALGEAERQQPDDIRRFEPRPPALFAGQWACSDAAVWLGWDHPAIRKRMARIEKVERTWSKRLGAHVERIAKQATPVGSVATPKGEMSFSASSLVCGEDLRRRYGNRFEGRSFGPEICNLEFLVENRSKAEMTLSWSFGKIGSVHRGQWLLRSPNGAEVVSADMIDARKAQAGSVPQLSIHLATGEKAYVLVGSTQRDLSLGLGNADEKALFRGYDAELFALRSDLPR